ncbi:MAG TPA: GNAT family N-acetyltransferase [Tepidisphaeraceae bacterium]|nr:GNAT family N-acetyltransferase [Tepidisphaeraceae bacterium]
MPFRLRDCLPFSHFSTPSFKFLDPGPLVDADLELVVPSEHWVDEVLKSCRHPLSMRDAPALADTSREQLMDFLRSCPGGRQQAATRLAPAYHFWMRERENSELPMAGGIGLRISNNYETVMYSGHIGYHVYPPARGRHYAERACRLLMPLAHLHGIDPLWITCNPDNFASRRTCERLGGNLVEIVPVPTDHPLYERGEKEKCRYRIDLPSPPPATA